VIDIILGDVLVVVARFRATEVVTLRCSKLSLITRFLVEVAHGVVNRRQDGSITGRIIGSLSSAPQLTTPSLPIVLQATSTHRAQAANNQESSWEP
jgi:hypothetical protein